MLITDPFKKLEQVDKLMNKRGFQLLIPDNCCDLKDVAEAFQGADWAKLDWTDLTYVKRYGKYGQHVLFATLSTTEKLYKIGTFDGVPFMCSHLDICRANFKVEANYYLIGKSYKDEEYLNNYEKYVMHAKKDALAIQKQLNKISSYME